MSASDQYIIFATVTLKPEHYEEAKQAVLDILPQTLEEPGCHVFTLHEDKDPDVHKLYFYEIFEDEEAFQFHHVQSYTQDVLERYKDWLASPVEAQFMTEIR